MKSIDFRVMYFLILYPSLSRLALWVEGKADKVEILGSSLMTYNTFKKNIFSFFIINNAYDLHDLNVNVIHFILKHYIS